VLRGRGRALVNASAGEVLAVWVVVHSEPGRA